ncbi:MAG: hypothetical protein ACLP8S_20015 [Solirubrobacteraceae bacterium]
MFTSDVSRAGKRWLAAAGISAVALPAAIALPSIASAAPVTPVGAAPAQLIWQYTGSPQQAPVGPGAMCLIAKGGDGGGTTDSDYPRDGGGGGAVVSGCIRLPLIEHLTVAVGNRGYMEGAGGATNSNGGWGYMNAVGGSGHPAGGDAGPDGFASGGGGGATIVQLNGTNVLVAGGGGGQGGGQPDMAAGGSGGSGGQVAQNGAGPGDGGDAKGGLGGAMPGSYGQASTVADTWLSSYSWGGAGGGGVNGGTSGQGSTQDPATGISGSGAGGGAGSSLLDSQLIHGTIATGTVGQNAGGVVEAWTAPTLTYQATPSAPSAVAGKSVKMTLAATAGDSPSFPLTDSGVTWTSTVTPNQGDTGSAPDKISGSTITMYQAGTHTVTASVDGVPVATATIDVTAAAEHSIGVATLSTQISAGDSVAFVTTSYDAYGNPIGQITQSATYSSNVSSDVVSGNDLQFFAAGAHTVTAKLDGYTAHTTVQVAPGPAVSIAFASDDQNVTIPVGGTVTFAVDAQDQYGNVWTLDPSQYGVVASGDTTSIDSNTLQFNSVGQFNVTAIVSSPLLITSTPITVSSLGVGSGPGGVSVGSGQPHRRWDHAPVGHGSVSAHRHRFGR